MKPEAVLKLKMQQNDADAKTIGEYLIALLLAVWQDGESFSGKRPFGNSGWTYDLYLPLLKAKLVPGTMDGDEIVDVDEVAADRLITSAIKSLSP